MRKYLIYTLGFFFAVSMLVSVIMYGLHVWAIQGQLMKDIFDFEKFATIDVVDIHLEKRVIKLMEKANEQKASQTREPTLSIEETGERLRKKMVDSSGEEAKFGV